MSSKLTRKTSRGGIEAVKKRVKTPGTVDAGIIDAGEHQSGDMTVASIGFVHEFGSSDGRIPERSFMRTTIAQEKRAIVTMQKKLLKKVQAGDMSMEKALGLIGDFMRAKISEKITNLSAPANAPQTVAKKGSSNPLVDTGQLRNSITFEVNR